MDAPSVLAFRMKDWPVARSLIEARQLPDIFDELACYVHSPEHCARSTLDERLPEGPVEPQLATIVMELLDLLTEVALDCFGHELFPAGPVGRKHFGFHPSAPYASVASRFERDGFRVLHASELVGPAAPDPAEAEASRARVRQIPKGSLTEREAALVEYVRSGGSMPQAGADHASIALQLGRLVTPRFERWNEVDGRILDVACAAGELGGVFEVFAARVNAHEECGHDTFGALRRELARRGIADGRILVALLRSGAEAISSATLHVVARHGQLDALVEAVRANEPSRAEHPRLVSRLLTWMSCVGAPPAAVEAVTRLVESGRAKDLVTDELRAHLAATHGYEGPRGKGSKAKGSKARAAEPEAPAAPPEAPPRKAAEPEAPARKTRAKAEKPAEPPVVGAVNATVTFESSASAVALGEPGLDAGDDEALLDAVNRKAAAAFRCGAPGPVTVRVTGRGLTAQEVDHAFGSHHWFTVKTGVDALELRAGDEGHAVPCQRGKYGVEVVAIRAPRGAALPDYVLMLREEAPARLPKRAELPVIATR